MKAVRYFAIGLIVVGVVGLWFSFRGDDSVDRLPSTIGSFPSASVVMVTLDTTRADRFGCYGSRAELTPAIDKLASRGILFENAQAVAPITLPSHASLLTGLLPTEHGVRNNGMFILSDEFETLAEVFSSQGYATGAFVSAQVLSKRYGLNQGFDIYDDDLSKGSKIGQGTVPSRRGNLTLDAAVEWIRGVDADQPLFLWLHLYDPHAPYDPPPEFRAKYPTDPYAGEIAFSDSLVARLVDELRQVGRMDQTVLTVLADHGESLGEHGEETHGVLLHQPTIKVPWILVTPMDYDGLRLRRPVSTAEVAPILASLVELPGPNAERIGRTVFTTDPESQPEIYYEAMLPMYQYGWSPLKGVRVGDWELISGSRDEVFDLQRDPRELVNLVESETLQHEHLAQQLEAFSPPEGDAEMSNSVEMRPSEKEALAALGYLITTDTARRDPPDPRDLVRGHVHVERSRSLMAAGRFDDAIGALDQMLRDDPENLAALGLKGQVYLKTGRLDEAERTFSKSLEIDPKNTDAMSGLCRVEMARGNFEKAIELARVGRTTRSPFGLFDSIEARSLISLGRNDEAGALVAAVLEERPEDPDVLLMYATSLIHEGKKEEAEAALRLALTDSPFHPGVRLRLGRLLEESGKDAEAVEAFEELLRIQPGDADTLWSIGSIKMKSDPEEALAYLEEAARLAPGRVDVLTSLGIAYIKSDRLAEGEATLRRAINADPDDPNIRNNLSIILIRRRRFEEAITELRELLRHNPDFFQARNNLAIALGETDELNGAENEVRLALDGHPDYIDARLTLAAILDRSGRIDEEVEVLRGAFETAPQRDDLRVLLAMAYARIGRCESSLELMAPFLDTTGVLSPEAHFSAARCFETMNEIEKALRHFEEVARRVPQGPTRQQALASVQRLSLQLQR